MTLSGHLVLSHDKSCKLSFIEIRYNRWKLHEILPTEPTGTKSGLQQSLRSKHQSIHHQRVCHSCVPHGPLFSARDHAVIHQIDLISIQMLIKCRTENSVRSAVQRRLCSCTSTSSSLLSCTRRTEWIHWFVDWSFSRLKTWTSPSPMKSRTDCFKDLPVLAWTWSRWTFNEDEITVYHRTTTTANFADAKELKIGKISSMSFHRL